jgi:L-threonylcarbamoyladenylate synthase
MRINEFEEDVQLAVGAMRHDGVILYPTDTIWGLGCGALQEAAIDKIDKIKYRPEKKSYLLLMTDVKQLAKYVANPPIDLQSLLDKYIEPTTFIYQQAINLPQQLLAADGSIGIRITQDPFCRSLIKRLRQPLVSTSANIAGEPSPANYIDIVQAIQDAVDYTVKWKQYVQVNRKASAILKIEPDGNLIKIR